MTFTALAEPIDTTAIPATVNSSSSSGRREPELCDSVLAELERGFSYMAKAVASKQSGQTAAIEQFLQGARAACDRVKDLLAELPAQDCAAVEMRFNALRSVVLDSSNLSIARAATHS